MERIDHTFPSGDGTCAAWLYPGAEADQKQDSESGQLRPCVVLAHGFGGVREARLEAFAERFAAAGISALVFDYRHFGASSGEPRQLLDISRQLEDWRSAISFARSLASVDPDRVAAWGTSFSGGHVAVIAAGDPRLAAAISQNPFMDGPPTLLAIGFAGVSRLTIAGLRDALRGALRRPPLTIPIVGPPGTLAAMSTPDAEPGFRGLFEPEDHFRNEVLARIALRVGVYRPGRHAARIRCPWLVAFADKDAITPPAPAVAAAWRAPAAELRCYSGRHFDIYQGPMFEQAIADQIAFLRRHLLGDPSGYPSSAASARPAARPEKMQPPTNVPSSAL